MKAFEGLILKMLKQTYIELGFIVFVEANLYKIRIQCTSLAYVPVCLCPMEVLFLFDGSSEDS